MFPTCSCSSFMSSEAFEGSLEQLLPGFFTSLTQMQKNKTKQYFMCFWRQIGTVRFSRLFPSPSPYIIQILSHPRIAPHKKTTHSACDDASPGGFKHCTHSSMIFLVNSHWVVLFCGFSEQLGAVVSRLISAQLNLSRTATSLYVKKAHWLWNPMKFKKTDWQGSLWETGKMDVLNLKSNCPSCLASLHAVVDIGAYLLQSDFF